MRTLEGVGQRENLCVVGPSGTGKSHFSEALGQSAVDAGMTVAWFTIEDRGALIRRHRVDDSVSKAISRITRTDLIIVDLCRERDYVEGVSVWLAAAGVTAARLGIVEGECEVLAARG
ncbi:ATP-binding protein [Kitasatospora sp. NPDC101176]|uniref:ATP-binding protein n=1 Tax=Kitasatospora sp. NPDC101176 TaxID=3364099 RepID=UPI00382D93BB